MSLGQFLAILRARWMVLVGVVAVSVLTTGVITLMLPRQYTGSAAVLVDIKSPDPILGAVLPGVMSPSYMATQVDLIKSERVARKVVTMLNLTASPDMQAQWQKATDGKGNFEAWLAGLFSKNLQAIPSRESNVIDIEYQAADPSFAAALANAFVEAYIKVTAELRVEPAKEYSSTFETLAAQLRARLEAAQTKLSEYQKSTGLMATDERLDVETSRLNELSQQVVQLQAITADATSRRTLSSKGGSDVSSEAASSVIVSQLKADIAREEARRDQLNARLGDAHPSVQEVQASLDTLRARLRAEYTSLTSSLGRNSSIAESRLAEAKSLLEAQRDKLLKLKEQRNNAAVLTRDVENLQRAYDVVQARLVQANMESQSMHTNLSVIKTAMPPTSSSFPRIGLSLALALFLGTVFGTATAMCVELIDRRVRSNEDVIRDLQTSLLGVMLKTDNAKPALIGRRTPPWIIGRAAPIPLQNH